MLFKINEFNLYFKLLSIKYYQFLCVKNEKVFSYLCLIKTIFEVYEILY